MSVPGSLILKLLIQGSNTGAIRALADVQAEAKKVGGELSNLDKSAGGLNQTKAALDSVSRQLSDLRAQGAAVLSFAGIGLGAAEIIKLADTFTQMTGRLRLATQYSGDYDQVLQMLRESARATRSDLVATVDLYSKISASLKAVGYSSAQSVGLVTTINQAIATSGASAQAAEAAIVQLGQGLGAGALRGDEFNSVMEQTPGLAQAISDGLNIPIGALRQWADEGKLTAAVVAEALSKVSSQVAQNFAAMPATVGQSMTNLRNEILVFIGATDSASNGTSALANSINAVAQEFAEAGPIVTAFSTAVRTMVDGLDGTVRLLKIVGIGLAGYAAAAKAALTGNWSDARTIWLQLGKDIEAVLLKPLVTEPKVIQSAVNVAAKRQSLEQQLADQVVRLEKLKAYEAGAASDNVAAKDKANVDARIADQKRLVDAVRAAWQDSLREAEKYAASAQAKLTKAADFRSAGNSSAFSASISGMDEQSQIAAKQQRMQDLQSQGSYEAARARLAAMEGDVKKYDVAAAAAEKRLKEALQLAEDIKDVSSIESISDALAKVQETGAGLDQKKAAEAKAQAEAQAKTLADLQKVLDDLTAKARTIEVQADITDADNKVKGLQAQLAELAKGVTVPVNVAQTGNAAVDSTAPAVGRAFGGPLPGWAPHDRADNVAYWGTPGEWVIQRPAVRYWGEDFLRAINAGKMPRFAFGGQIGGSAVSRLRIPTVSTGGVGSQPDVLDLGALGKIRVRTTPDTSNDVADVLARAALRFGR